MRFDRSSFRNSQCSAARRARPAESFSAICYLRLNEPQASLALLSQMNVERVKYVIWAADWKRAVRFYCEVFGAEVIKTSEVISEVSVGGATIGIHGGGEGKRTWTGMSFQVPDVIAGAHEVVAAGGQLAREPQPERDEPPHLAMCVDTEGNELDRKSVV